MLSSCGFSLELNLSARFGFQGIGTRSLGVTRCVPNLRVVFALGPKVCKQVFFGGGWYSGVPTLQLE